MNNNRARLARASIALLVCPWLIAACQPKVTPVQPLTAEESRRVDTLATQMTPRCVGRYRLELPSAFVLDSRVESHRVEVEGITLWVTPMPLGQFEAEFDARRDELSKTRQVGEHEGLPHLRAVLPIPGGGKGGVFDRAEGTNFRGGREIELLSWRDGFETRASTKATDLNFPEVASDPLSKKSRSNFQERLSHLFAIHERLRGRRDDEVPDDPGFCFPNGFLRGPQLEHEMASVSYTYQDADSGTIMLTHANDVGPDKTLLEREAAFEEEIKRKQGTTLRRGSRESHGLRYEEWLMSKVSSERGDNGRVYYDLRAELNSKHGNMDAPLFMMEFVNRSTFTASESVALWDRFTSTLRPQGYGK